MVELTRDDWTRLTALIHGYGSMAALEHALHQQPGPTPLALPRVDLADMVSTEAAHQLGGRPAQAYAAVVASAHASTLLGRVRRLLWPASAAAWITLALILLGGVSPVPAAATGLLGRLGLHLGLRSHGGVGRLLWQMVAASCVIA